MTIETLLSDPPKLHFDEARGELISSWKLSAADLHYLDRVVRPGMTTIETGAGVSTVVFAMRGALHTSIVPDPALVGRIRDYCDDNGVSLHRVTFLLDRSEDVLPGLADHDFDFALIDGRHGFPAPFIDWYYLAERLKVGGQVMIDDLHIWTCLTLVEFLAEEADWFLSFETPRAATFVKLADGAQRKEYEKQPFVWRRGRQGSIAGRVRYLAWFLRRGKLSLVGRLVSEAVKWRLGSPERR